MSLVELAEHASYWRDAVKVAAFRSALHSCVTPDSVVLDLGCGTGLLGLLACEAGARKVYAVDGGAIINLAKDIAWASPFGDRIEHIREWSISVELPEQVDIVVADQIGGFGFDAGTNEFFADAKHRLAKPDAVFIPAHFSLRVAPITCQAEFDDMQFWLSKPLMFDLSSASVVAANIVRQLHEQNAASFLATPVVLAEVASWDASVIDTAVEVEVQRCGTMHGIAGMFVAHMASGTTMTNDPSFATPMAERWQDCFLIEEAIDVCPRDVVHIAIRADPLSYQITWAVTVSRCGRVIHRGAHSSALGVFFAKVDLGSPEGPPRRLEMWRWTIDAIARGVNRQELIDEVLERFGSTLADRRAATKFVAEVGEAVR